MLLDGAVSDVSAFIRTRKACSNTSSVMIAWTRTHNLVCPRCKYYNLEGMGIRKSSTSWNMNHWSEMSLNTLPKKKSAIQNQGRT